jgi:hypothetical protein
MANVYYLDVDDEITSAAARIRASQDPRVGLVVPPGSRIATSRINFRLLAREALERNRALSIVSSDPAARALAASAGLPVYATVAEFEADQGAVGVVAPEPAAGPPAGRRKKGDGTAAPAGAAAGAAAAGAAAAGAAAAGAAAAGPPAGIERASPAAPGSPPDGRLGARSSGASAPPAHPAARPSHRSARLAAASVTLVLIALVLGSIGVFLLPSATIVVTPKLEAVGPIELSIRADPNATATDPVAGVVPATILTMDFSASGTFNATGKKVNSTAATGTVRFNNNDTGGGIAIPSGSKVSTGTGVTFATTQDVTVPRAQFQNGFRPGSASVGVSAVAPGPAGNVPSGAIDQVPSGYSSILLNVSNPTATSGGTSTTIVQVQKKDTDAALASLTKDLKAQYTAWLTAPSGLSAGSVAFPKTGVLGPLNPDNDPTTLIGIVEPTFDLGLTATGTVTAVDESAVTSLATGRLQTSVTSSYSLVAGSTAVTVGTPRADSAAVIFPVTATASVVRHLDPDTLRAMIAGKSVEEARSILAGYGDVEIQTWPGFVGTIPSLAWRLTLTINADAAPPSPGVEATPGGPAGQPSSAPSSNPSEGPSGFVAPAGLGQG